MAAEELGFVKLIKGSVDRLGGDFRVHFFKPQVLLNAARAVKVILKAVGDKCAGEAGIIEITVIAISEADALRLRSRAPISPHERAMRARDFTAYS